VTPLNSSTSSFDSASSLSLTSMGGSEEELERLATTTNTHSTSPTEASAPVNQSTAPLSNAAAAITGAAAGAEESRSKRSRGENDSPSISLALQAHHKLALVPHHHSSPCLTPTMVSLPLASMTFSLAHTQLAHGDAHAAAAAASAAGAAAAGAGPSHTRPPSRAAGSFSPVPVFSAAPSLYAAARTPPFIPALAILSPALQAHSLAQLHQLHAQTLHAGNHSGQLLSVPSVTSSSAAAVSTMSAAAAATGAHPHSVPAWTSSSSSSSPSPSHALLPPLGPTSAAPSRAASDTANVAAVSPTPLHFNSSASSAFSFKHGP
jgi:hypothetical protein